MASNLPAGYASAAWIFSSSYGTAPFVFTFGIDVTGGISTPTDACDILFDAFVDGFGSDLSEAITLDKVQLSIGQGGGLVGSYDSTRTPFAGTRTGSNDPIALALLVNKRTNLAGRKGRGRMFIPGVLAGDDTGLNGDLTPSAKTKHEANLGSFLGGLFTDLGVIVPDANPVLLHSDATTPTPINVMVLAPKIGVLRKRMR